MRLYEPNDKLSDDRLGEPSAAIRQRVEAAREIQHARFEGRGLTCNADMGAAEVREFCGVDGAGRGLLRAAMTQLGISARSYHRILSLPKDASSSWRGRSRTLRQAPFDSAQGRPGGREGHRHAPPGGGNSVPASQAILSAFV